MRALISSRGDRSEDGVVLLWVALMMVALIGMGALVIDVGAAYVERRQLQNGADAAALAVAADCALGDCQDESATANAFADSNANDNASNIDSVCGAGPGLAACATPPSGTAGATGYVQVTTSTHNPANADDTQVRFFLAPVLDAANVGATVHATAAAAWGPPAAASTIPLIFSFCEFAELGGSVNPPVFPSGTAIISFHGSVPAGTCPAGPSGADLPGGFGWLDAGGDCEADIDAGGWVDDKTGNGVPNGCDPADWRNVEVLLPVYDQTNGLTGSNGEYHVIGFAGFRITGYRFPGNRWPDSFPDCPLEPGNSGTCIRGEFTRVTATGDEFGGPDLGARIIKMIG
jgi:Flp pilus assembly protein TadG